MHFAKLWRLMQEARRARSLSSTKAGQMEKGMASFVKQTIGMYRSGFDSRRMLLQVPAELPNIWTILLCKLQAPELHRLVTDSLRRSPSSVERNGVSILTRSIQEILSQL